MVNNHCIQRLKARRGAQHRDRGNGSTVGGRGCVWIGSPLVRPAVFSFSVSVLPGGRPAAQARFQTQFLRRPPNPCLRAQRAVPTDRRAIRSHSASVIGAFTASTHPAPRGRPRVQRRLFASGPQARPRHCSARATNEARKDCLDVTQHDAKVFILLDRECFEPALPDVTTTMIMTEIAADVSVQQPLHPAAQIAIADRPESEMEMIGHDTISETAASGREAWLRRTERRGVVVLRVELPLADPPLSSQRIEESHEVSTHADRDHRMNRKLAVKRRPIKIHDREGAAVNHFRELAHVQLTNLGTETMAARPSCASSSRGSPPLSGATSSSSSDSPTSIPVVGQEHAETGQGTGITSFLLDERRLRGHPASPRTAARSPP